jgi:hypothetical protein
MLLAATATMREASTPAFAIASRMQACTLSQPASVSKSKPPGASGTA